MVSKLALIGLGLAVGFYFASRPHEVSKNVFAPSPLSTVMAVKSTTGFDPSVSYASPYSGDLKILVIGCEHHELPLVEGNKVFHTGNHPAETFVPMLYLAKAGFSFDVATPTGKPVAFEEWAMPTKDEAVKGIRASLKEQLENPLRFDDIKNLDKYAMVFVPGGHGAVSLLGHKSSEKLGAILDEAVRSKVVLSLCHGPAAFHTSSELKKGKFEIVAFPDFFDENIAPVIGYLPRGGLSFKVGAQLHAGGMKVLNKDAYAPSGETHIDRNVITGDSPDAANALGKLAAEYLLKNIK